MTKITLNDVASFQNDTTAVATVNANSATIETAFDNTLSRDGTSPNQMNASLDMNSNRILNLPAPVSATEPLRLQDAVSGTFSGLPAGGTTKQVLAKASNLDYATQWNNPYPAGGTTGQALVKNTNSDFDVAWSSTAASGISSINGATGAVTMTGNGITVSNVGSAFTLSDTLYQLPANASGSSLSTTGTITATSTTLNLVAAIDFVNNQGIRVNHAGVAHSLNQVQSPLVTPTGASGSTAYSYSVATIGAFGSVGAAIQNINTATGNATLSGTNYNTISWTAPTGATPAGYAIYGRLAGNNILLALVSGTTLSYQDTGNPYATILPDWIPSSPQAAALASYLLTTIVSGAGTTTLTLAAAATTTASGQVVIHDDTVSLQNAVNSAATNNKSLYIPGGIYRITSALSTTSKLKIVGSGYGGDKGQVFSSAGFTPPQTFTGLLGSVIAPDITCGFINATTNSPVVIEHLEIMYVSRPVPGVICFNISAAAGGTSANTQSAIRYCLTSGASVLAILTNVMDCRIESNSFFYSWENGVLIDCPNYPSFTMNTFSGNLITGNASQDPVWNKYQYHFSVKAGGDFKILNNKFQECSPFNSNAIYLQGAASGAQTMEPIIIVGNSIEGGCANGITIGTSNASFNANQIVITGNQLWAAKVAILVNTFGTTNYVEDLIICGNAIMINNTGSAGIQMDCVAGAMICGNTFNPAFGGSSAPAINLGAHTSAVNVQSNFYSNQFVISTPPIINGGSGNTIGGGSA